MNTDFIAFLLRLKVVPVSSLNKASVTSMSIIGSNFFEIQPSAKVCPDNIFFICKGSHKRLNIWIPGFLVSDGEVYKWAKDFPKSILTNRTPFCTAVVLTVPPHQNLLQPPYSISKAHFTTKSRSGPRSLGIPQTWRTQ